MLAQNRQKRPVNPESRLYHVRDKSFFFLLIKVTQVLPARFLMIFQVKVASLKPIILSHFFISESQYSNCFSHSPSLIKYSISICSNSRVRKIKFPGVISLRNALPICAMPKGIFG